MRARALLAEGKIRPEDYFYFIKNMPAATKLLLAEGRISNMSDVAKIIGEMTPERLGEIVIRSKNRSP